MWTPGCGVNQAEERKLGHIKTVERIVLLRAITILIVWISSGREDVQFLSDLMNAVAWSYFLLRTCWFLVCRYPFIWWLVDENIPNRVRRGLCLTPVLRSCRPRDFMTLCDVVIRRKCRPRDFMTLCDDVIRRRLESLRSLRAPRQGYMTNPCQDCNRTTGTMDDSEQVGLEMSSSKMSTYEYRAPSRKTVDRGEAIQNNISIRDKDI
jgi:hypothetical protein